MAASDIGIKIGLQGAEQVRTGLAGVTNSLTDLANRAGGLRDSLSAIAPTLAAAFSVGGIAAFVKSTTDALDRLNDISDATGSSVEEISKLERVAKLTGASMDTVTGTLIKFNAALKEAKPGSGADAALKAIGLEAAKLRELDPSVALRKTAEALAGFADDGNKARIVQELFGKSLREAAPLLKDLAEFGELNASVTGEQAAQAEKFNRQLAALNANVSEAGRAFALELFPTISAVLESFTQFDEAGQKINTLATAIRVPIEALTIFGANIGFVFGGVGREIGAIAAQVAALSRLDLAGFRAISEAVKQDGERARRELEAFERRVLGIREAGGGRGFVNPEFVSGQLKAAADIATATNTATAAIDKNAEAVKRLTGSLEAKVAAQQAEIELGRSLTAAEQLELKLRQDLADGTVKLTEAEEKRVLALIGAVAANDELLRKEKQLAESRRENLDNATRAQNAANSLEDQVRAAREAVEAIGLQGVALAELEAARIRDTAAEKERRAAVLEGIDPEVAASYRAQAAALRELAGLKVEGAVKQATIDGTRAALDDARRTFDQVSQSLADALLNGGKSAGEALKRYFKTLILQPIIKAIVNPIVGAAAGALGFSNVAQAANVAGGGSSDLSLLSSGASFASIASQAAAGFSAGVGSTITSLGTTFGSTAIAEFGLGLQGLALPSSTGALALGGQAASGLSSLASGAVAAAPYIAAALVALNALGVFRSNRTTDVGLVGTLGAGTINEATVNRKGGTLFNGPEYTTNIGAISQSSATLQRAFDGLRNSAAEQAKVLGIGTEAIKGFTVTLGSDILNNDAKTIGLSLKDLTPEQQQAKITEALNTANESLAKFVLGTTAFSREGESAVQTLARLSGSLGGVNQVLGALGLDKFAQSLAGADLASQLSDAFGGIANLQQASASYFDNFFTAAEKTDTATRQLTASLGALGIEALPATREAFRAIVESQDLTTESGRATFAALVQLSGAFAELVPESVAAADALQDVAQATRSAADILKEREGLERQLLQLQGKSTELRRLERDALDESNRALFDQITALQNSQAAAQAAAEAQAELAAQQQRIEQERFGLEGQLLQLLGNSSALRERERAALDETNRALFDQITTLQGAKAAAQEKLQELADAARELDQQQAQQEAARQRVLSERLSLEGQLLQLQGDTAALRERERAALDDSNKALFDQINALRDQQSAAEAATRAAQEAAASQQRVLSERLGLETRLLQLQGNTAELRRREREALDETNRALFDRIVALEDERQAVQQAAQNQADELAFAAAIRDKLAQEQKEALDAQQRVQKELTDRLRGFARSIKEFRDELIGGLSAQSARQTLALVRGRFDSAAALAAVGDEVGLSTIVEASKALLDTSARLAASPEENARTVAQVIAALDSAERAASVEQKIVGGIAGQQLTELQQINQGIAEIAKGMQPGAGSFTDADGLVIPENLLDVLAPKEALARKVAAEVAQTLPSFFQQAGIDPNAIEALSGGSVLSAARSGLLADQIRSRIVAGLPEEDFAKFVRLQLRGFSIQETPGLDEGLLLRNARFMLNSVQRGVRQVDVSGVGPSIYNAFKQASQGLSSEELAASFERALLGLTREVSLLRVETRATAVNTAKTAAVLDDVTQGGTTLRTEVM